MPADGASEDPVVGQLREQISDNDRAIVEAINRRLKLVRRLKEYKASRGFEFVDPDRESWMVSYLARANRGPLSADGLRAIFEAILDLTKREVGGEPHGGDAPPSEAPAATPRSRSPRA